jgi:dipeptidyl aminopeptidase/acylaminoacyl peptidase
MAESQSIWVGKDEEAGIPVSPRKDLDPPSHWRLEAIAATERPRSLTVGADGRTLLFVEDRDTSDVWTLDLDERVPRRITTGRDPAPYWEDDEPRLSPDGKTVAYVQDGRVMIVPFAGGPPKALLEASGPAWLDDERLVVAIERDRTTRLAIVNVEDTWPQRLATNHGELDDHGDEGEAAVSPDGREVAYTFAPRDDLNRGEIRVVDVETGAVRALTGSERMHDRTPAWSPDGTTIAYSSERSGWYELHLVGADGSDDRQLSHAQADFTEHRWHPDGSRLAAVRGHRNRFDLVVVDAAEGTVDVVADGGSYSAPDWTADGHIVTPYEDHATPPELRLLTAAPGSSPVSLYAPAPLSVRAAPHVTPEDVTYTSFDGLEIHAFLFRPPRASPDNPVPAVVYPHGGPTSYYGDEWDGHAQYFLDKGYAWLAPNFRGSTGYGRDFERKNHDVWGVDDTKDCLAAADFLRILDWVDGDRLAIFGASYGSYMALLAATDDDQHRFRCAVCKYGDCDIVTSWAQGDRGGVQDLERMMGPPSAARAAYRQGSPVHRLENIEIPLLVAHGEQDERVSPKQSEELVAELRRLGKTFQYVTYPTEGHGLLRAAPQVDFYRRLERFFDWYLM